MQLPKGPRGLPVVGSLVGFGRDPLRFLLDFGRNYGDVAFTRLWRSPTYIISHPELIEELLIGRHRDSIKDYGTRELIPLVGRGLLTSEHETWRRNRKIAAPPLQPKRIANYADTMVACAERSCASFRQDEVRDIYADMMGLTLEIVGKTLLSVDARDDAEHIAHILDVAMAYFAKQLRSWHGMIPPWIPTVERVAFHKAVEEIDEIIYRMIARGRTLRGASDTLLGRLINARDEDGEAMSDQQLRDEAITMLLAGHETTALALAFAVYLLSEHPDAANRLRSEIDAQLGVEPARFDDLPRLTYLDAVVRETLRLYPPAYVIGREMSTSIELGGFTVPAGSQIMMSAYVVQRDERWFADPERFDPERWLTPRSTPLPRFAYFPFGGGPRVCIGNHFAQMEIALVLATMMQQLELTVVPGFELRLWPVVTLRPESGVRVLVRRRRAPPQARRSPWSERVRTLATP